MNKVFCYQHDWPNTHNEWARQIWLWKQNWTDKGWVPVVLTESDARQDPLFDRLQEVVSRYPTVNTTTYEQACFLRHLAFRRVGAGLISDYDVLNFALTPAELERRVLGEISMASLDAGGNISLAGFSEAGRERLLTAFLDEDFVLSKAVQYHDGKPHVSDMTVFMALHPSVIALSDTAHNLNRLGSKLRRYPTLHVNNDSARHYGVGPGSKSTLMADILLKRRQFQSA